MRMHVDEAGGDDLLCRVDSAVRFVLIELSNGGDLAVSDRDVRVEPTIARAIDDASITDQDVHHRRARRVTRQRDATGHECDNADQWQNNFTFLHGGITFLGSHGVSDH